MALPEFDVKCVLLDITTKFLNAAPQGFDVARDPGFVPVIQLGYLLGRTIPVAVGPFEPLRAENDTAADRTAAEQSGIDLLLQTLRSSAEPVVISMVGSARLVAAAFNREPELLRTRTKSILLNAGSMTTTKPEWNVTLDVHAYKRLWKSGLPIHWYPCATEQGAFDEEHGTHWKATQRLLLKDLSPAMLAWFEFSLAANRRGDFISSLGNAGHGAAWETILSDKRNMWSTASLVMAAGRTLSQTSEGWRFVSGSGSSTSRWPMFLDPISASVREDGNIEWQTTLGSTDHRIFRRQPGREYGTAMGEALHALLQTMNN